MKRRKLIGKRNKVIISIIHKYSILEGESIEAQNNIKYVSKIIDWICNKAYNIDNSQPLTVEQISNLLIRYYGFSKMAKAKIYRKNHEIDLYKCETSVMDQRALKHNNLVFHKNGVDAAILDFINTNKVDKYSYVNRDSPMSL